MFKNKLLVEVFYDKELQSKQEGLFTKSEKDLFSKSAALVRSYINQLEALNIVDGKYLSWKELLNNKRKNKKNLLLLVG
ncbi:MAG: hypothetical protein HC831_09085 [Chloroflexia bacterium]|nr:hypothetical protein [Chloroflexia bacterium]